MKKIPVAMPHLAGNESKYVMDCIQKNWISSTGEYVNLFEENFATYCGVKHAISVCNGTAALHLALVSLNLNPGDEVLIPAVTYIATANAVRYCGATPVFVDVSERTLNIDPHKIEQKITKKTKGIIPVHLYGHPAAMEDINNLAKKYGLWVLEDAAEAHGAEYQGVKVGAIGVCGAFSFYGNKIMTTGEGGMLTTNDDLLAEKIRLYRGQGMDSKQRYRFPVVGYNYRLTNLQAAIGVAQLETLELSLNVRNQIRNKYRTYLASYQDKLVLPGDDTDGNKSVCWMYTVYLRNGGEKRRDAVMNYLADCGIETRPVFYPVFEQIPYKVGAENYPVASIWSAQGINLPTYQDLTEEDIEYVCAHLTLALE